MILAIFAIVSNSCLTPLKVFINAGLWDVQDRPLQEYAHFLPILTDKLTTLLSPSTQLVWLLSPPVNVPSMFGPDDIDEKRRTFRTNSALIGQNNVARDVLLKESLRAHKESGILDTNWRVFDIHKILNPGPDYV